MNPDESFTLCIVTDNKPTGIVHKSRIEDIPSLTIINKPAETKARLNAVTILIPVIGAAIIIALLLWMWISNRKDKKIIQQLSSGCLHSTNDMCEKESKTDDYDDGETND